MLHTVLLHHTPLITVCHHQLPLPASTMPQTHSSHQQPTSLALRIASKTRKRAPSAIDATAK